ncbi:caspase recruitment domain-containing protein 8 isoform X3 [Tupaia chinensis]|uniref:caspase recruitment domain-containing protein 8 isoform X3 n=1 Tax=Tupaia chinensis TaxID=246437 RepID=UPI000FFBE859|nr:caspase recruitment domain-containing protein 8 isoform X3 [Tupaia chinensis]
MEKRESLRKSRRPREGLWRWLCRCGCCTDVSEEPRGLWRECSSVSDPTVQLPSSGNVEEYIFGFKTKHDPGSGKRVRFGRTRGDGGDKGVSYGWPRWEDSDDPFAYRYQLLRGPGHRRNSCRFKTKQGPGSGERVSSWGIGPESGADQPVIRAETADFGGTREDSSAEGVSRLTEGPSGGADFTAGATPSLTIYKYSDEEFEDSLSFSEGERERKLSLPKIPTDFQSSVDEVPRTPADSLSGGQESPENQETGDVCSGEEQLVSSFAAKLGFERDPGCKHNHFLGPDGKVDIELIDESVNRYSVHFPTAGYYLWLAKGLGFVVRAAVTVRIAFDSWGQHLGLSLQLSEQWMVAGPLFDVTAEPEGAVAEVHLPHFICLQAGDVDVAWFQVAHFKDEGMVLEKPARVEPFYAVLENPSFSLMGILLRIASGTCLPVPITSTTLIYYHSHPQDIKFHLYLIPSDALLTKAINDEESRFHGVRLQTSPPMEPLNFGSRYIVSGSPHLEIMPKELRLSYRSPGEIQPFSKFYAGQMKEPIRLEITDRRRTLVWETVVKPVDLQLDFASVPPDFSGAAFVKEHHRQLQVRLGDLNGVLDDLLDSNVLTENEKDLVEQGKTRQQKNEILLSMVEKKGDEALELFYESVKKRDPYLVSYLSQWNL